MNNLYIDRQSQFVYATQFQTKISLRYHRRKRSFRFTFQTTSQPFLNSGKKRGEKHRNSRNESSFPTKGGPTIEKGSGRVKRRRKVEKKERNHSVAHEKKDDESRVLPIGFATERSDATPERSWKKLGKRSGIAGWWGRFCVKKRRRGRG